MPDITMCNSENCNKKETCYRYKATPSPFLQSYADFKKYTQEKDCKYYLKYININKEE